MPSLPIVGRAIFAALLLALPAFQAAAATDVLPLYTAPADPNDPAEQLSRYLRALAAQPRDLAALIGAGRAALAIGDANAAVGFYARADEVSPRDGRIKAALASALVQMDQPREALKLLANAVALGVPEADIASDRGLARDLRGDNKRAQADYQLALHSHEDPEATRRLALSLAISGNRAGALVTLAPLIARGDKAAGRARAFVLALTGDAADAEQAARTEMPIDQAAALTPFLGRLATLKAGQKAAAVHLGLFPSTGRKYSEAELFADASASASETPAPPARPSIRADTPLIPRGAALGTPSENKDTPVFADAMAPTLPAPRRRPGQIDKTAALATPVRDTSGLSRALSTTRPNRQPEMTMEPAAQAGALDSVSDEDYALPPLPPRPVVRAPAPTSAPTVTPARADAAARAKADADARAIAQAKARAEAHAKASAAAEANAARTKAAADAALKAQADAKAKAAAKAKEEAALKAKAEKAKVDAKAKADAKAKEEAALKAKADAKAKKEAPERYWVQIASGKNKADFGKVWDGLTDKAPKLLRGRATWTAPWRASNRLLVGPFKTDEEAQAFVNTLGKTGLSGIQFTTHAGTKVERLPLK